MAKLREERRKEKEDEDKRKQQERASSYEDDELGYRSGLTGISVSTYLATIYYYE